MNLGLLQEKALPTDMVSGEFTPIVGGKINPGGQWDDYLPVAEFQNNNGFDRMACVTYSLENCLETVELCLTGIENNYSDRFLAKLSGTTHQGNYLSKVFDTILSTGLAKENDYPDDSMNWEEYYAEVPSDPLTKAKEYNNNWNIYREWVTPYNKDNIIEALDYTPLQVTVRYASGDGILNPLGDYQHAVMCYGYVKNKYWKIFDHYTQTRKKYAWDYEFGTILKPTITLKDNHTYMKFEQNRLYLLIEGNEQKLSMFLDGNLVEFPTWSMTRENSNSRLGKWMAAVPVKLIDWNSVPHTNSKGEQI